MPAAAPLIVAVMGPASQSGQRIFRPKAAGCASSTRELRPRLLGKSRGLTQRYARVVDRPADRGRREEVHVEVLVVLEVDEIAAVGRGLRTGAGAARPAEIGSYVFLRRVDCSWSSRRRGRRRSWGCWRRCRSGEAFGPIAVLRLAGGAEEVLDHLEARPGAALGFKGVGGLLQALAEPVARQELFVGPEAARWRRPGWPGANRRR